MINQMTINQLCKLVRGSSPRPSGDPRYYGGNVPRLMVKDVSRDGMYVTPKIDSLTEEGAAKSRPMSKGDLVVAVSGDPGEPSILAVDACIHDGFVGLRELQVDKVFTPYLYRYFKYNKEVSKSQAVGAIYKNLNTDQIKALKIPLPPLDQQKNIAAILDAADGYRQKTKALIAKYDELTQSLFLDMFGDPVANNKKWKVDKLKSLSTKIGSGNTPKGGKKVYVDEGITFFRSMNVWKNNIVYEDIAFIDEETHSKMPKSSLKHKDILMTKTGRVNTENSSLGRAALYLGEDDMANVNGHVYLIRLKEGVLHEFVLHILTSKEYRDLIRRVCVGGIDKRQLNKDHIEDFPIIAPPQDMQDKFVNNLKTINHDKESLKESLAKAEDLFNSLLQKAFKGELA